MDLGSIEASLVAKAVEKQTASSKKLRRPGRYISGSSWDGHEGGLIERM